MDDAIDEMQKTAGAIDLYDVKTFEPEMCDIAAIIVDAARLTVERCRCCATSPPTARACTN